MRLGLLSTAPFLIRAKTPSELVAALIVTVVIVILRVPQVCRVWKGEKGRARMPGGPLTLKWSQFLCPVTLREAPDLSRWQVSERVLICTYF